MLAVRGAAPAPRAVRVPRCLRRGRAAPPPGLIPPSFCSVRWCDSEIRMPATECGDERVTEKDAGAVRSTDLVDREYGELKLKERLGHLGHVRIRQHVNPLSSAFSAPVPLPNWSEVFADPTLPLMVDIGSGSGRFLIWLAKMRPEKKNFLGLEIRHKLAERAQFWAKDLNLGNICFLFANVAVSFDQLVTSYPGPLALVSILCPDPHFKRRHWKRRVVSQPLVDSIAKNLTPGGQVFVQSDVLEVAQDMRAQFDSLPNLFEVVDKNIPCDVDGWLLSNPLGIRTEREIHAEFEGATVFRRVYRKRHLPSSNLTAFGPKEEK